MNEIHLSINAPNVGELQNVLRALLNNGGAAALGEAARSTVDVIKSTSNSELHADYAPPTPPPNYITFGLNVYESTQHAFAIGHKLYGSADEAARRATQNGNYMTSFALKMDVNSGAVAVSGRDDGGPINDRRYFALLSTAGGHSIGNEGSETADEARRKYPSGLVFGVALVDDETAFAFNA